MIAISRGSDTFVGRMGAYFREMLPLPQHLVLAALVYLHIAVFARVAHELPTPVATAHGAVAVASLFGLMVILRLMDELKDEDIDRKLFPDRPLPSGRVLRSDIRRALLGVAGIYLVINLAAGSAFLAAALLLGYAFLMYRRFFAPRALRRSLSLTLVTHNPVVALMVLYGLAIFAAEHGLGPSDLRWDRVVPFVVLTWSPFLAWELARKIRSAEEEDDYVTYSRILGRRRAVLAAWAVQAVGVGAGFLLWRELGLHWIGPAVILTGFLVNLAAGLRFLCHPGPRTSRLGPFATVFLLCVLASQVAGALAAP